MSQDGSSPINGEKSSWRTGVSCYQRDCDGMILAWAVLPDSPKGKPFYYGKCDTCTVRGSWYEIAKAVKYGAR